MERVFIVSSRELYRSPTMSGTATSPNHLFSLPSTLLPFQLCPSAVQLIDSFLRFSHLRVRVEQSSRVTCDGRIFSRGALLFQRFFRLGDALLDRGKLARFQIRKLLPA